MNKKILRCIFIVYLCIPSTTSALLVEFFSELNALSEFNARNRAALYDVFSTLLDNEASSPNDTFDFDCDRSPEERIHETIERRFTFADLAGDIPADIVEIVDFIREPERFARVGAKMPKGVLLYGPPGTGKTSIARAIAGEAEADFFTAAGSDFIELYVGMGPKRVRELFERARGCKRAIIFIDEIDAIGGKRSGETNSEYRNTLNELLKQMDGFELSNVTVIASTNRIEDLDEALLRPGRFDRLVEIGLPSLQSRINIFELYCRKIAFYGHENIFVELAHKTSGFSGADIKNAVNEAAVLAARANSDIVTTDQLREAVNKGLKQKRNIRR